MNETGPPRYVLQHLGLLPPTPRTSHLENPPLYAPDAFLDRPPPPPEPTRQRARAARRREQKTRRMSAQRYTDQQSIQKKIGRARARHEAEQDPATGPAGEGPASERPESDR